MDGRWLDATVHETDLKTAITTITTTITTTTTTTATPAPTALNTCVTQRRRMTSQWLDAMKHKIGLQPTHKYNYRNTTTTTTTNTTTTTPTPKAIALMMSITERRDGKLITGCNQAWNWSADNTQRYYGTTIKTYYTLQQQQLGQLIYSLEYICYAETSWPIDDCTQQCLKLIWNNNYKQLHYYYYYYYTVFQKNGHPFYFFHNSLKWWSIYTKFLPDVAEEMLI